MIQPGQLNQRVVIQWRKPNAPARTTSGAPSEAWARYAAVWAQVQPLTGREQIMAGQVRSELMVRVRIRYLEGVTADMRLVHRGAVYAIESVANVNFGMEMLELMCASGAANA